MRYSSVFLLFCGASHAFQLPFHIPFLKTNLKDLVVDPLSEGTPRIAIIGAGAGGSSAAFWISKAKERFGLDVQVDVYDRESYIGGRSTTVYPYNDTSLPPVELGASIFVRANKNMWRATQDFNLTRRGFQEAGDETGVWDGEKMLFNFSGSSWWDTIKILWRYGYHSPKRTDQIVQSMIKQFLELYTLDSPKWDNVSSLAESFGWTDMVSQTMSEYLESHGVTQKYARELVEAATRVNYGQNVDVIHALEGACSMATADAAGVQGGNFQIFEQFLYRSGAKVFLDTPVESITPKSPSSSYWTVRSNKGAINYKAVILAAPFHSTNITLPSALSSQIPEQPYVHLHVTLLTTTSPAPNATYFAMPPSSNLPKMLLTTYEGVRNGGKEPEFNSLSYHGVVREGEWGVKIFSKERISDEWLESMFMGQVGWVHRKEWDAYPKLPPTASFPSVKLDQGFYYVNAFEPFISTMETETIASRNVVDLLLNEDFGSSICGSRISGPEDGLRTRNDNEDFVLGWDC